MTPAMKEKYLSTNGDNFVLQTYFVGLKCEKVSFLNGVSQAVRYG